jgi:hypothetical protein
VSDTLDLFEVVRPGARDLPGGASFELQFTPQAGRVTASLGTLRGVGPAAAGTLPEVTFIEPDHSIWCRTPRWDRDASSTPPTSAAC